MKSSPVTDQDFRLSVLLRQTGNLIRRAREKEMNKYGIPARQSAILFTVQAIGGSPTPAEISRWQLVEPHSISDILSRMERDGLIRKDKDLERKNLVRVSLTEKGQQLYRQSLKRKSIHNIMSSLSEEEHQQLSLCLEKLRDNALKELGMKRKPPFP